MVGQGGSSNVKGVAGNSMGKSNMDDETSLARLDGSVVSRGDTSVVTKTKELGIGISVSIGLGVTLGTPVVDESSQASEQTCSTTSTHSSVRVVSTPVWAWVVHSCSPWQTCSSWHCWVVEHCCSVVHCCWLDLVHNVPALPRRHVFLDPLDPSDSWQLQLQTGDSCPIMSVSGVLDGPGRFCASGSGQSGKVPAMMLAGWRVLG